MVLWIEKILWMFPGRLPWIVDLQIPPVKLQEDCKFLTHGTKSKFYFPNWFECSTGKCATLKIHTKPRWGLRWHIFHIFASEDIREFKHDVYGRRQTPKIPSELVFLSSNPELNLTVFLIIICILYLCTCIWAVPRMGPHVPFAPALLTLSLHITLHIYISFLLGYLSCYM